MKRETLYVSRMVFGKRAANKLRKTFAEQHGATHLTITAGRNPSVPSRLVTGLYRVRGRMALTELARFAANESRAMQEVLRDENATATATATRYTTGGTRPRWHEAQDRGDG